MPLTITYSFRCDHCGAQDDPPMVRVLPAPGAAPYAVPDGWRFSSIDGAGVICPRHRLEFRVVDKSPGEGGEPHGETPKGP